MINRTTILICPVGKNDECFPWKLTIFLAGDRTPLMVVTERETVDIISKRVE
jgi:hypothetical protein